MSTLLIRLAGPLQAWGTESKFDTRRTGREPTKSGVIGLVAAALGIRRDEEDRLAELAAMRFGVRVDQEGALLRDYHTARNESTAYVTQRYYLSDAVFVAGLESNNDALLRQIDEALHCPVFPLYLGRRSCPPSGSVSLGILPVSLEDGLRVLPSQGRSKDGSFRIITDAPSNGSGGMIRDLPLSFNPQHRQYAYRKVTESHVRIGETATSHDPMAELDVT